jgi:hypothetical protein
MVDGSGYRPYVGRMLVPMMVDGLVRATPEAVKNAEIKVLTSSEFDIDFLHGDWLRKRNFPFDITYLYFVSLALFLGFAWGGKATYEALYGIHGVESRIAGLLLLLAFPLWAHGLSLFYDPMTIFLGIWLLYAVVKKAPWLCVVLIVLACMNKETGALYVPVVLFGLWTHYRQSKKVDDLYYVILVGVVSVVSVVLIQVYRVNHFANNPGTWMEHHWADAQRVLFTKYWATTIHEWLVMGIMLTFAFLGWKSKPSLLKVGTICVFIPLVAASIVFGRFFEIRALYDAFPILGMMAIPTAINFLQGRVPQRSQEERVHAFIDTPAERIGITASAR